MTRLIYNLNISSSFYMQYKILECEAMGVRKECVNACITVYSGYLYIGRVTCLFINI